jgi:glycosyltransferase involved in cell wall biosynthesis
MRICFISSMHPTDDKRVFEKEACSLAIAGFDVIHLAPSSEIKIRQYSVKNVKIITYPPSNGLLSRVLNLPMLYRKAHKINADAYHCNEIDSWIVGIMLKIFNGRLCVFDAHEHYPEEFSEVRIYPWMRPFVKRIIALTIYILSKFTDRIVLAKISLLKDFSFMKKEAVWVVQNYSTKSPCLFLDRNSLPNNKTVRIIHLGLFNKYRGWPQLLKAISLSKCVNLELLVLGEIDDGSKNEFFNTIKKLGLDKKVFYKEWLPYKDAMELVSKSDIGIICFQPGLYNHIHALPHKMFDYMSMGIPLIAPDFSIEISKIVKDSNCGFLVDPSNPKSIAQSIDKYCDNKDLRVTMGRNGYQSVLNKYNWENEANKLITMYKELDKGIGKN